MDIAERGWGQAREVLIAPFYLEQSAKVQLAQPGTDNLLDLCLTDVHTETHAYLELTGVWYGHLVRTTSCLFTRLTVELGWWFSEV
jgi:hypothetical protein